jgi:hypothetical protein
VLLDEPPPCSLELGLVHLARLCLVKQVQVLVGHGPSYKA